MKRNELPKKKTLLDNCGCCCRRNILGYIYTREVNCIAYIVVAEREEMIYLQNRAGQKQQQIDFGRVFPPYLSKPRKLQRRRETVLYCTSIIRNEERWTTMVLRLLFVVVVAGVVFFSLCLRLRFLHCYRADVVYSCDPSRNNDAKTRRFCFNGEVWWRWR